MKAAMEFLGINSTSPERPRATTYPNIPSHQPSQSLGDTDNFDPQAPLPQIPPCPLNPTELLKSALSSQAQELAREHMRHIPAAEFTEKDLHKREGDLENIKKKLKKAKKYLRQVDQEIRQEEEKQEEDKEHGGTKQKQGKCRMSDWFRYG